MVQSGEYAPYVLSSESATIPAELTPYSVPATTLQSLKWGRGVGQRHGGASNEMS
jgi:hypothetical protein